MNNSIKIKNRNFLVIVFELIIIALGIAGITLATSSLINKKTSTLITAGDYSVDFVGNKEIKFHNLVPINDKLINYNTKDNVIRIEFSLKGVKENGNDQLIYDVMLNEMNIDCALLNKYTKWNLYKNGALISNGSFDPTWDGNVLTDNMRLTNIQEDLPKYNDDYDNYVFILWISEACDDLTNCELVDQTSALNSELSMKIFIALYSGKKKSIARVPNYDNACANTPVLHDNMTPVNYQNGSWVVVDKRNNNQNNLWYDYENGKWANAVILKNKTKNKVGTTIENDDVYAYFVWIPRFKYKTWNVTSEVIDSYNAYENGIDIVFENGLSKTNQNNLTNNQYITHPAFGDNLKGFWISKYELSKEENTYLFISNNESYRNDTMDNYQNIANNITSNYNLGKNAESHGITNLEWGAITYLSHSKYGVCQNNGCDSIAINDSYVSGNNKQDTTTRNIYGVYDMAGAASEYVFGNEKIGSATAEIILSNGDTWYQGHGLTSTRDYLLRGGISKGLFYFGDSGMGQSEVTTRVSLISK